MDSTYRRRFTRDSHWSDSTMMAETTMADSGKGQHDATTRAAR
jgi:hypothetical protein